jgi:hypothetical protein
MNLGLAATSFLLKKENSGLFSVFASNSAKITWAWRIDAFDALSLSVSLVSSF